MTAYGIDLSMSATGVAMWDGESWNTATIKTKPADSSHGAFLDRADEIAAKVIAWCDPHDGDILCIEGPALQAKSSQLDRIFGLWWHVYAALRAHHAEPFVVPPTVVKQLATGKGNAGKDEVLIQSVRRLDADIANNNEADAAWLAVAGAHIAELNPTPLPQAHLKGLLLLIRNKTEAKP